MAFRTASVFVPLLLTQSTVSVQNVPAPTAPGMRSEASKPMPAALVHDVRRDLQLVGPGVPVGRGRGVGRDGAAGLDPAWRPCGVARNSVTARTSGRSSSTIMVSAEPSTLFWARIDRREREDADVRRRRRTWTACRWPADPGRSPARTRSGSSASSTSGAAMSLVEHRVHGRLLVGADDGRVRRRRRSSAVKKILPDVLVEGVLDARVLERDLVADPVVVVLRGPWS